MNTTKVILVYNLGFRNILQFHVKNVFLHGDLKEETYMDVLPGHTGQMEANIVCKLKTTLYRLKQSPRTWFGRFTKVMTSLQYK